MSKHEIFIQYTKIALALIAIGLFIVYMGKL